MMNSDDMDSAEDDDCYDFDDYNGIGGGDDDD